VRGIQESRRAGPVDARLLHRQVTLERAIRDHQRSNSGAALERLARPPPVERIRELLDGIALLEFVQCDATLYVVSVVAGRFRLRRIGPLGMITGLVDRLLFALRGLNRQWATPASLDAALALLRHAAGRLGD